MSLLEDQSRLQHPLISILLTLAIVLLGFQIIGPIIGLFLALPFYPGNILEIGEAIKNPTVHPELKTAMFIMQGCGTLLGLIVFPALMFKKQHRSLTDFFRHPVYLQPIILVPVIVMVFMVFNSIFIEWNQNIEFPKALSGFEDWARTTEDKLAELTEYLTKFDSIGQLILAFVVIAVLPAIGEEIVFRGMIQHDFYRATKNIHLSVWVSAILFSAIHLQFYGFIPRMLLGALFGYLYYWSGSLLMPIIAHFINNGFTVIAMYFYQQGVIDMDLETTASAPWQAVVFSGVVTCVFLYVFKKFYDDRRPGKPDTGQTHHTTLDN